MHADAVLASVDTDHRGTLARQPVDDGPGKGAGRAGDNTDLIGEPFETT
jgi:hypothetical protein